MPRLDPNLGERRGLGQILRDRRKLILARWQEAVSDLPATQGLSGPLLLDHIPALLEELAAVADGEPASTPEAHDDSGTAHADQRVAEGFDPVQVHREYAALREIILHLGESGPGVTAAQIRRVDRHLDDAIATALDRFAAARRQTLSALDSIAAEAQQTRAVEPLLDNLARLLLERCSRVDSTAIYLLRDGSLLRSANAGLEERIGADSLSATQGPLAEALQRKAPLILRDASAEAELDPRLREAGLHAFAALPLVHQGDCVGLLTAGSRTAFDFSEDDQLLFRHAAARATVGVVQHQLHFRAREARAEAEALFLAAPAGLGLLDPALRLRGVNDRLAELLGMPAAELRGKSLRQAIPELASTLEPLCLRVLETGEPIHAVELAAGSPQSPRWLSASVSPMRDDRVHTGLALVLEDVTDRQRGQHRLKLQAAIAQALAAPAGTQQVLETFLGSVGTALGFSWATLWRRPQDAAGEQGEVLSLTAQWARKEGAARESLELPPQEELRERGLMIEALRLGRPVSEPDLAHSDRPRAARALAAGVRGGIAVPIALEGSAIAVLELWSEAPGEADPELLEALRGTASQLALFLARLDAQARTRQSEASKRAILEAALDGIATMDAQGRVREFNPAAEKLFGWTREEALGRELAELIIPPRFREAHRKGLARALSGGAAPILGRRMELPALRRDGSEFPVELTVTRVQGLSQPLFTGFLRDITDRREREQDLQRVSELFRNLVEASPLAILVLDPARRVQVWNRAAEQLFGLPRAEVVGRRSPLSGEDRPSELDAILQAVGQGHSLVGVELQHRRAEGEELSLQASFAPLRDGQGQFAGVLGLFADVTERKRAHEDALQTARFREHFADVVSHDLRNPLSAILGASQLLLRMGLPDRQGRAVSRIVSSAERMARMINDLLDFTRSRLGGGFPIAPNRVDLREVCRQAIEEFELASERKIEFEAHGDAWGSWDPDRIAQVVSNLLGNALQHGAPEQPVRVTLRDAGAQVLLQTQNAGAPIPPELLVHVFEPYKRGEPSRGGRSSGSLGLGLYIVRQIVAAHGGSIDVTSTAESGTVFTVILPRRARASAAERDTT